MKNKITDILRLELWFIFYKKNANKNIKNKKMFKYRPKNVFEIKLVWELFKELSSNKNWLKENMHKVEYKLT